MKKRISNYQIEAAVLGIVAGLVTCIMGFGAMYFFWTRLGTTENLPGFFDYHTAIYGDGLCLPVLIASLVAFLKQNKGIYKEKLKQCKNFSGIFLLIGILIQASWIISDRTTLNWTIPEKHCFNIAGWYHAVFFSVMFGIVAYMMAKLWYVIKKKSRGYSWFEKNLLLLCVTAFTLFLLFFVSDEYTAYTKNGFLYLGIGSLLLGIIWRLLLSLNRKVLSEIMFSVPLGILAAFGIFFELLNDGNGNIVFALAGALYTYCLWKAKNYTIRQTVFLCLYMAITSYGIFYRLSARLDIMYAGCILILLLLMLIVYNKYNTEFSQMGGMKSEDNIWKINNIGIAIIGVYIWLCTFMKTLYGEILKNIFIGAITLIFQIGIVQIFEGVFQAEDSKNNGRITKEDFKIRKGFLYTQIIAGIIAIGFLLGSWLLNTAVAYNREIQIGKLYVGKGSTNCILLILFLIFGIAWVDRKKKAISRKITFVLTTGAYLFLIADSFLYLQSVFIETINMQSLFMIIISFFVDVGAAGLLQHGYEMNLVTLRELKGDDKAINKRKREIHYLSYVMGVGIFMLSFMASIILVVNTTWMTVIFCCIQMVLACEVLPLLSAWVMCIEYTESKVVPNSPMGGVAQDGLMIFLLVIFGLGLPCIYCDISNPGNMFISFDKNSPEWLMGTVNRVTEMAVLILYAILPVKFCLKNNLRHLTQQYEVAEKQGEMKIWNKLHKCLNVQSKQAAFALLPYIWIAAIKEYMAMSSENKKCWRAVLREQYFDRVSYAQPIQDKDD